MARKLLILNAGSSSLKFAIFRAREDGDPVAELRGQLAGIGQGRPRWRLEAASGTDWNHLDPVDDHESALRLLVERLGLTTRKERWIGAGHRVVHGGVDFARPCVIEGDVLSRLRALNALAPLHQPHNVGAIESLSRLLPDLPQVACFDTAFHRTQPDLAQRFALPEEYWAMGIRRYGFHGLSYESIVAAAPGVIGALPKRLVIAHLGNGASMAAVADGRCLATTMGFSTLDGLVMGTRSGTIDPGVLLHLMREGRMSASALEHLLYHESGLKGVSGLSADMKTLLESRAPGARMAIDLYVYRIGRELGSMAAALGGIDALVFTGGVGENASVIRDRVLHGAHWLGFERDAVALGPRLTREGMMPSAWVIPTDEELMIARHARALLARPIAGNR